MSLKVLVAPADRTAVGFCRLRWPAQALAAQGMDVGVLEPENRGVSAVLQGGQVIAASFPECSVLVLQRPTSASLVGCIPFIQARGTAVVVDFDDDLSNISPGNVAFYGLHPKRDPSNNWHWAAEAARLADLVTVSTPPLAAKYGAHGRVRVLRNCVPDHYLTTEPNGERWPGFGWAGALWSHPDDLQTLGPTAAKLTRAGHEFRVVGPPDGVGRALGLGADPPGTGLLPFHLWAREVARLEVGIAPLADTVFNVQKCLDASTRIATRRGIMPIGEMSVGDSVWADGHWRKVEAVDRNLPTVGVRLTTATGRRLRLTKEHRLWGDGRWIAAGQIEPGVRIALAADEIGQTDRQRIPWPSDSRMSRRGFADRDQFTRSEDVPTVLITERWARFFGLYAGDGAASGGTAVAISCDGQDQDLIDLLSDDLVQMGMWPGTQQNRTFDGTPVRRRTVSVASAHLLRVMRHLGMIEPDHNRRVVMVPEVIWRSPKSIVAAYLSGVFEADGSCGSIKRPSTVTITMKHRDFILDLQRLLVAFGIESFVAPRWNSAGPDHPRHEYWELRLRRAGSDIFAKEIGFLSERKRAQLALIAARPHSNAYRPQTWTDEIVLVEPCWVEPVDIQVEGSVFAAAGFVSHNSSWKILEMSALGVPWVASALPEYSRLAALGAGVVVDRPKAWLRELGALLGSEALRDERAGKAKAIVSEMTYSLQAHLWGEAWESAAASRRAQSVAAL